MATPREYAVYKPRPITAMPTAKEVKRRKKTNNNLVAWPGWGLDKGTLKHLDKILRQAYASGQRHGRFDAGKKVKTIDDVSEIAEKYLYVRHEYADRIKQGFSNIHIIQSTSAWWQGYLRTSGFKPQLIAAGVPLK